MYVKVEPTGCCERKGLVQVRLCMYLDADDYGYEKCHVQVPVIPEGGYTGKRDDAEMFVDINDYDKWFDGLPREWQDAPFHNHFMYVEASATETEIMDQAEAYLKEAYQYWTRGEFPNVKNAGLVFPKTVTTKMRTDAVAKASTIKTNAPALERAVVNEVVQ